jgi:hypothetical protein
LNEFKSALKNKRDFGNDGHKFEGLVTYYTNGKIETEILEIALITGGYEPVIRLDIDLKGRIITSEKYHLDFNPKFWKNTKFEFDKAKNLIKIVGINSPKLGNFEVTISEV